MFKKLLFETGIGEALLALFERLTDLALVNRDWLANLGEEYRPRRRWQMPPEHGWCRCYVKVIE